MWLAVPLRFGHHTAQLQIKRRGIAADKMISTLRRGPVIQSIAAEQRNVRAAFIETDQIRQNLHQYRRHGIAVRTACFYSSDIPSVSTNEPFKFMPVAAKRWQG